MPSNNAELMSKLPRPFADKDFYQQTLNDGFIAYPDRKQNYLRYQAAQKGEFLDYLPVRLDIENVSRCNYRCTMCQVSEWPQLKRADDMTFEDYTALLDSQYGLTEIKLQGMGEPLLGKCYFDMIEYARARHIWVRSTTNASMLHLRENYKKVIDADICELQVSIDGATAPVYEKIRLGGKFDRVSENCKMLNGYCTEVSRNRTRMWVVVQRDNVHELELFPALASELGFKRLTYSLDVNDWGQEHWREKNDEVDMHRQLDPDRLAKLVPMGLSQEVEVSFWLIDEKYDTGHPEQICPWPFERGYVSSDMRLVPCCLIANPEVSDLGDASDLTKTWNDSKMAEFRRAHLNGDIPRMCKSCYVNVDVPLSLSKTSAHI